MFGKVTVPSLRLCQPVPTHHFIETIETNDIRHLFSDDHGAGDAHVVAFVNLDGGAGFGLGDGSGSAAIVGGGRHDGRARHEATAVSATTLTLLRIQSEVAEKTDLKLNKLGRMANVDGAQSMLIFYVER